MQLLRLPSGVVLNADRVYKFDINPYGDDLDKVGIVVTPVGDYFAVFDGENGAALRRWLEDFSTRLV